MYNFKRLDVSNKIQFKRVNKYTIKYQMKYLSFVNIFELICFLLILKKVVCIFNVRILTE